MLIWLLQTFQVFYMWIDLILVENIVIYTQAEEETEAELEQ